MKRSQKPASSMIDLATESISPAVFPGATARHAAS
jgi:hypothetical protein